MLLGCRRAFACGAPLVVLWLSVGCANRSQQMPLDASAGLYDRATLEYRLDAGRLNSPLAVARIEGQLVSYDQLASPPVADHCIGTLKIQYPHPEGRLSAARVTLEVVAQAHASAAAAGANVTWWRRWLPGGSSPATHPAASEVWQLDIPKGELDALVARLQGQGFFEAAAPAGSGVQLSLNLNAAHLSKPWTPVPELDTLMLRARSQGRLVNYTRDPHATAAMLDTTTPADALVDAGSPTPPTPRQGSLSWGAPAAGPAVTRATTVDPFLATPQYPQVVPAAGTYAPPPQTAGATAAAPPLPTDAGAYPDAPAPPIMADAPQARPAYR